MDAATSAALRALLDEQPLGALGTLRAGGGTAAAPEPFVSMVPLAWLAPGDALIHVSALSPHTRDLLAHPQASLLLMAPRTPGDDPLALPRVSLQVQAEALAPGSPVAAAAAAAHRARFASAALTLELGDFRFFRLQPRSARVVAGFGRAHALTAAQWRAFFGAAARA